MDEVHSAPKEPFVRRRYQPPRLETLRTDAPREELVVVSIDSACSVHRHTGPSGPDAC